MPFPTRVDPWIPKIDARLLPQVIENARSIIERDQAAAILYANDGAALPAFAEIHRARRTDLRFPFIAVGGRTSAMTVLEEGGAVQGTHEIVFEIADQDADPDELALRLQAYYRAICFMVHAARVEDWIYETNATDAIWGDITARLQDIQSAPRESGFAGYVMSAEIVAVVQLVEG